VIFSGGKLFFGKHFLTVKNSMVETKGMAVFNGAQTQKLE